MASQFPQWAGLPVTRVPSAGTDNAMYRLGHALVARLPRIPSAVADVDKEQRWLPQLAPALPLAVPVPLGLGAPDALFPYPWSVYPWFPGADAVTAPIVELDDAAARLGRFVAALGPFTLGKLIRHAFADYASPLPFRYAGVTMCAIFLVGLFVLPFAPETKGKPLPS